MNITIEGKKAIAPCVFTKAAFESELFKRGYFPELNIHAERWRTPLLWCWVKPVVMYEDAAKLVDVKAWQRPDGTMILNRQPIDEHIAKRYGSTHTRCNCGTIYRSNAYCKPCADRKRTEQYNALEAITYKSLSDVDFPIVSEDGGTWIFDQGMLEDHLSKFPNTQFLDAEPGTLSNLEYDHWGDDLPEDYDEFSLPDTVRTALEALNTAIDEHNKSGNPVAYWQGKRRIVFDIAKVA